MTSSLPQKALYPARSSAGIILGQQLYKRGTPPMKVWAIAPTGVEIAASAARAMNCGFDVVVAAHIRLEGTGIVGAIAEDADAITDSGFSPKFSQMEVLDEAVDAARRAIKTERLLFRGQRALGEIKDHILFIVDGHVTTPWKLLAAAEVAREMEPQAIVLASPVSTQAVKERVRARSLDFACPTVIMDPQGHPVPFGDPQDPSAERLRSIVLARQAA